MQLMLTAAGKLFGTGLVGGATTAATTGALTTAQILQTGAAVAGGVSTVAGGLAQKSAADFEAKQLEARGKSEMASASAQAAEERRRKELILSRARAAGAASGGGRDFGLEGAIAEEGTYRELLATFEGQEAMAGFESQASAARFGGRQAMRGATLRGISDTGFRLHSLKSKYG